MDWTKVIEKIDARKAAVAAERDTIDDLLSDLEELRENCREAWDDLQHARDALSKIV